tara:strand:+ start:1298 stop:2026 length:729 start_codon:yes stop_codon:yes gene_type:complete
MIPFLRSVWQRESFHPTYFLGIWINPFFIIRMGLLKGVKKISKIFKGGKLLDVGCGSKPYQSLFKVDSYTGIDIEVSGHDHKRSKIDKFYDGKTIPYEDHQFDYVFSSETFEHVFNLEELLQEINRVLKKGGKLGFTCPFVWDEHEQPYDFARYTSFAIDHLLNKNGFELIKLYKSTNYIETVIQMFSAYIYQHILPKNKFLKIMLSPIIISPVNIIGILLGKILPRNNNFYHNNIVIAQKL